MASATTMDLAKAVPHLGPDPADEWAEAEPPAAALRRVVAQRRTGWLVQETPRGWLRLGFRDGALVDGDATAPLGSLGQALVRYGLSGPGRAPFGAPNDARLAAGRALHLGDLLLAALERGRPLNLDESAAPAVPQGPLLPTSSLVLEACRRTREDEVALRALGRPTRVPRLDPRADLSRLCLSPEEREAIAGLGHASLQQLASTDSEGVSLRVVLALYCLGLVQLEDRARMPRACEGTGDSRRASADQLVELGRLCRDRGWRLRAAAVLREALRVVPEHAQARAELQQLPCSESAGGRC